MSKIYILHNNNAKKLLINCQKKCAINNQVSHTYFYFECIFWFLKSIWIFSIFFTFLKISKNERNVTNFRFYRKIPYHTKY